MGSSLFHVLGICYDVVAQYPSMHIYLLRPKYRIKVCIICWTVSYVYNTVNSKNMQNFPYKWGKYGNIPQNMFICIILAQIYALFLNYAADFKHLMLEEI